MYAVFVSGGKQYRVTEGQSLQLESLDAEEGKSVEFDQILLVGAGEGIKVGQPTVAGAKIQATVVKHGRGKKVNIIKFKRRKHHMKRMGHRQNYTEVKIEKIVH